MLTDLAVHLAGRGWEVAVIASAQRYDNPRERLPKRERVSGVEVHRIWTTRFGRAFLPGRAVDYLTFYASAFFALLGKLRRGTVVIALTDPPLISVVAMTAAKLRGARLVNWIQDLFPEVAEALGIRVRGVRGLRDRSLRAARVNVVLGELMAGRVPNAVVRHNWADAALHPVAREANPLRRSWGFRDELVVGYSGNVGRAHEVDTLVEAMQLLAGGTPSPERGAPVRFLIIGGGAQFESVRRRAPAGTSFQPYQPREALSASLSAIDVHLVSLQPQLEGLIVPSKFYGVLAVARPVLFIGAKDGELARIIDEHRCGMVVEPGDADGLARAIRELADDPARAAEMGRRGRALYETRFAPAVALVEWERILEDAAR